jgi:hypothetical protein
MLSQQIDPDDVRLGLHLNLVVRSQRCVDIDIVMEVGLIEEDHPPTGVMVTPRVVTAPDQLGRLVEALQPHQPDCLWNFRRFPGMHLDTLFSFVTLFSQVKGTAGTGRRQVQRAQLTAITVQKATRTLVFQAVAAGISVMMGVNAFPATRVCSVCSKLLPTNVGGEALAPQ